MKNLRKSLSFIVLAMALCFTFAISAKVNAAEFVEGELEVVSAQSDLKVGASVLSKNNFKLGAYNVAKHYFTVKVSYPSKTAYMQVQLQNAKKQSLVTYNLSSGSNTYICTYSSLAYNKIYYYRARAIYKTGKVGQWSYRKAFSTVYPSISGSNYVCKVKAPKVTGVKKYELWMSATSASKGFKKIGAIKPGATIKISKFNGRTLRTYGRGHNFYFFLKPYLNSGSTDGIYYKNGGCFK